MKKRAFDIFIWVATIGLISAIFFLPDRVAVHWDMAFKPDRYGSRYEFLIFALLPIGTYYGMLLTKKIDPKRSSFHSREKTYEIIRKGMSVFFVVLCIFFLLLTTNLEINGTMVMCVVLGSMNILIGNYMPKLPQNFFLGIRTPWTLSSEIVWKKTQVIGGYSFVFVGVLILVWGLLSLPYAIWVLIFALVGVAIFACVYSFIIYKKLEKRG